MENSVGFFRAGVRSSLSQSQVGDDLPPLPPPNYTNNTSGGGGGTDNNNYKPPPPSNITNPMHEQARFMGRQRRQLLLFLASQSANPQAEFALPLSGSSGLPVSHSELIALVKAELKSRSQQQQLERERHKKLPTQPPPAGLLLLVREEGDNGGSGSNGSNGGEPKTKAGGSGSRGGGGNADNNSYPHQLECLQILLGHLSRGVCNTEQLAAVTRWSRRTVRAYRTELLDIALAIISNPGGERERERRGKW